MESRSFPFSYDEARRFAEQWAVGAVISWYDYSQDPTTAGLIKSLVSTGLVFVRVNPIVGLGLGVLDLTGGSDWIYNQTGDLIDENF